MLQFDLHQLISPAFFLAPLLNREALHKPARQKYAANAWIMDKRHALALRIAGWLVVPVFALVTTLVALYLMQAMIATGTRPVEAAPDTRLVDFVRVKQTTALNVKRRKLDPPPPPERPPEAPPSRIVPQTVTNEGWNWQPAAPVFSEGLASLGANLMMQNGDYLPIVKVQPVYPRRAMALKLVGWVIVEFTVSETGAVMNPVVLNNCVTNYPNPAESCRGNPNSIFDDAAVHAALRFKYKPKVADNVPIATAGVRNKIYFELYRDTDSRS